MSREALEQMGYAVDGDHGGPYGVRGFGLATMAADDDALTALAEPEAHAERRFQSTEPEAAAARAALEAAGYSVSRVDPTADIFEVLSPMTTADALATTTATGLGPADLIRLAGQNPRVAFEPAMVSP